MKKIVVVVGIRPNFVKAAPLIEEFKKSNKIDYLLVHTGQHYDYEMSKSIFRSLKLPKPDINLEVGSKSHAVQTGEIMVKMDKVLKKYNPDIVVTFGDGNSTLAAALTAKKEGFTLVHIEAGMRSYDERMPEEINRRVVDHISDILFTTSEWDNKNLSKEGIDKSKIHNVGNIMIDSIKLMEESISNNGNSFLKRMNLLDKKFCLLTLHRASNVDNKERLSALLKEVTKLSELINIVFPIHPRTKNSLKRFNLSISKNVKVIPPLAYDEFLLLIKNSEFVVTDSGGVQHETAYFRKQCLTLRENTEWIITLKMGTNKLIKPRELYKEAKRIINEPKKNIILPEYWDGKTSQRITRILTRN